MIVTDHFVNIHTSRTAGTFLNKLILENVPGAQMLQYHGHLSDLPEEYSHLPENFSETGYLMEGQGRCSGAHLTYAVVIGDQQDVRGTICK